MMTLHKREDPSRFRDIYSLVDDNGNELRYFYVTYALAESGRVGEMLSHIGLNGLDLEEATLKELDDE